jgi:hypothetical protein
MGTYRVQMKGVFPWLIRWACCVGTGDFCPALAVLVSSVQNIFFLTVHFFNSFVSTAQQVGQAVVLGRLTLSVCLCSRSLDVVHGAPLYGGLPPQ